MNAPHLDGHHVVLVGLPGAGKSTVGPLLAARLGRPFLDFDAEIARRFRRSVADQFARDGEAAFRLRETVLSDEFVRRTDEPHVLAPGGGWVTNTAARHAMRPAARTVYLRVPPAVAAARLAADPVVRPLVRGAPDAESVLATLLEHRGMYYEAADYTVDADGVTPEAVAEAAADLLREPPGWWAERAARLAAADQDEARAASTAVAAAAAAARNGHGG